MQEDEITGGALSLNLLTTQTMVTTGICPCKEKFPWQNRESNPGPHDQQSETLTTRPQGWSSVYLNVHIFGERTERQKILHRVIASIPWLQTSLNFFMNGILIRWVFHTSHIPRQFHAFGFDHLVTMQVIKRSIPQFSARLCCFLPLGSKQFPDHPTQQHPGCALLM